MSSSVIFADDNMIQVLLYSWVLLIRAKKRQYKFAVLAHNPKNFSTLKLLTVYLVICVVFCI